MNRNYIEEIALLKGRSEFASRYGFSQRLSHLQEVINKAYTSSDGIVRDELLRYVPIASVACMEAFFRSAIKEIIDFGSPFLDNAEKFNQARNFKIDFNIVKAFQNKHFTIGEFVSHALSCNSLANINSNMTTLIGLDFLNSLKSFNPESIFDHVLDVSNNFTEHHERILSDISRTFELRHIFCHEFGLSTTVSKDQIAQYFESVYIFLNHTSFFIWNLLYPDAVEMQSEMNEKANIDFERSEEELNDLVQKILESIDSEAKQLFENSIDKWKVYREAKAMVDSESVRTGTMYPLFFASSKKRLTQEKIQSLNLDYEVYLKRRSE